MAMMRKEALTNEELLQVILGTVGVGVPAIAAYVGHAQAKLESSVEHDKDFERRLRNIRSTQEAIDALGQKWQ